MRLAVLALLVLAVASEKCSSHDVCGDGKFCAGGDDGKKVGQCRACVECEENHDAVDGKCPCGKGKGKKGGGDGGDKSGEMPKGPACKKHKDCPKTDFCSTNGCLKCKSCEEHGDSVSGKCPCGPARKRDKKGGAKKKEGEASKLPEGPACKKHKDCPKTDFCSTNGCLKCKSCEEHDMSANGKCPCGPARKRDKGGKGDKGGSKGGKGQCSKNEECSKGQFCMGRDNGKHVCSPCGECHQNHDSAEGKCLNFCQVKARDNPEDEKKGRVGGDDGGGEPAKGPACKKHKDCPKTDFCSTNGCLKCKRCEEHDMSANGKCPCGPARKRDKKKKAKDEL